jgi:hypothetical protein
MKPYRVQIHNQTGTILNEVIMAGDGKSAIGKAFSMIKPEALEQPVMCSLTVNCFVESPSLHYHNEIQLCTVQYVKYR